MVIGLDVSTVPSLAKVAQSRDDVCLLIQSLVDPSRDLRPEQSFSAFHTQPDRDYTHHLRLRVFAAEVP